MDNCEIIVTSCGIIAFLFLMVWLYDFMVAYFIDPAYYDRRNFNTSTTQYPQQVGETQETNPNKLQLVPLGYQHRSSPSLYGSTTISLKAPNRVLTKLQSQQKDRYTPFLAACWNCDVRKIALHIARGANTRQKTRQGETGLILATYRMAKDQRPWNPLCLRLLIDNGCPIDEPTNQENTALHVAVKAGNIAVVKWLLDNGASVFSENKSGWRPMSVAQAKGRLDIASLLWNKYFEEEEEDETGTGPGSEYHSALD